MASRFYMQVALFKIRWPMDCIHTQQDWSRFGSRSGAIPKYLIQHRGVIFGSGRGAKIMAPCGTKIMAPLLQQEWHFERNGAHGHQNVTIVANGPNMAPPQLGGIILENGAPSTDFYSTLVMCVVS